MAREVVTTAIAAPADAVWTVAGDFGGLASWFPGIEKCELDGDARVITAAGQVIREELLERDDSRRTLTYAIVDGLPVEGHRATVTVTPEGDGCQVEWAVDVDPPEMASVFSRTYAGALAALQAQFA